nr:MAG TPA: hypothetical protein [Caudoviricetes sp.]
MKHCILMIQPELVCIYNRCDLVVMSQRTPPNKRNLYLSY